MDIDKLKKLVEGDVRLQTEFNQYIIDILSSLQKQIEELNKNKQSKTRVYGPR